MNGSDKVALSILIPTKDEERNLAACIDSVAWTDEVVVFDSLSTDGTLDIAREKGAQVVQCEFDNFANHKNWALDNIEFRNEWLLIVDADERATDALVAEIRRVIGQPDALNGYYVAGQNWGWGRALRCIYPNYNLRLIRRGKGRYERRVVHEHMLVEGGAGYLAAHLVHRDEKGMERYFDRHNTYTSLEAVELYRSLARRGDGQGLSSRVFRRGPEGRRVLKNFAYRYLPARPIFLFLYMYFIKGGLLDGRMGFR